MFALVAIAALVSMSVATPWYAAGYCADTTDQCTTDAWRNDCHWNQSVRRQCAATCGLCTSAGYFGLGSYAGYGYVAPVAYVAPAYVAPVCTDAIEKCAEYVSAGWCSYEGQSGTKGYVSTNCRRSCGLCHVYKK